MDDLDKNKGEMNPDDVDVRGEWVVIAEAENRTVADFAVNGLKSYEIPAVLDARPGVLGTAGLKLRSMRTGKVDSFRIMVPEEYAEEAAEVVKIFLGGNGESESENDDVGDEES